ncbi:NAD nucleotidase [Marinomonas mediterranea]|jgi:NAD pyrophosphatase/5''-nucleotidase NadN|uniref:NAD pyrophosphatase/5'-nucleotidase NadN n=1 Tax=Marinomonas mediterranea (strain ATCC 700492 / JCM 21426 / NBRC 103028 / MMB-1) TaxID=717774 RepID=F2JZ55_MARM1|nr:NAD nucleotidase [Marinomonas mediterranea]ADZ92033.1 NAD pyrophosphatase/5'-nucleotidase NadN [Marinomonas mediterranea MMB-1]WCN10000.1 NAD nucleotidase [Marinomonas mediterranea]WCN18106.1 NAD nucleotidase [Marinomonas mediterranea MMB-1]
MLRKTFVTAAAASLFLTGCQSLSSTSKPNEPLDLKIVHINDHHSHLTADKGVDLTLGGKKTRVAVGGFPSVVTEIDEITSVDTPVVKIHAGDAITGDLYYTLFKGEADAALMNEACFDVFTLGNHEFDAGDEGLVKFLDWLNSDPNCTTDVISANVKPEVGVSPLAIDTAEDYFTPYTIKEYNGEKVGFIGIDIANKTKNSSSPDASTLFLDEAETSQKYINELEAMGVNKIVLVTHYQYQNDLKLAAKLEGVDVIIGGDSHTLLGDFASVGLDAAGPYPTKVSDASGNPVCVAQAWQYSAVVGELDVSWNKDGVVTSCAGTPHLLLADSFKRKNADGKRVELTGAARDAVYSDIASNDNLSIVEEDASAAATLAKFSTQVDAMKGEVIGRSASTLCLERIPGQGRSKLCDRSMTASHGADISNIVAKAFRNMSKTSDIAIQNGGGVRVDIAEGNLTIGDAYTLLPFSNTIVELDMTGEEIHTVLEEAFDYATAEGGSTGAYPYASGLRWKVNATMPKGKRFYDLEVMKKGESWKPLDPNATYKVATNDYIAGGKDGYVTFGKVVKEGRVLDTYLDYAQSFVDYVMKVGTIDKLPLAEYSTQVFINKDGVKQ